MDKLLIFMPIYYLFCTTELVWTLEPEIPFCDSVPTNVARIPGNLMRNNVPHLFRVTAQDLECPTNSSIRNQTSLVDDPTFMFYPSGEIVVPDEEYLLHKEYCVKRLTDQFVEIKRCEVRCGDTHTCISKCCPPHQIWDVSEPTCVSLEDKIWEPVFYIAHEGCGIKIKTVNYHLLPASSNSTYSQHQPYKHIRVNSSEGLQRIEGLRFRLMRDGHLNSQSVNGKWTKIGAEEFCIDGMTGYINSDTEPYKNVEDQVFLYVDDQDVSYEDEYEDEDQDELVRSYLFIPLMFISAVFLLATSCLYLLIWEKHNIHGWTIFAFVTTEFFMFIFLAVSLILSISMYSNFGSTAGCKLVGILTHFFYLSTMCWMSVINFDLWLTFRNVKPSGSKSQSVKRFILYSLFGFGVPLIIVGLAITLDFTYEGSFGDGTECEPPFTLPLYGQQQCYMQKGSQWFYLYIPMAILVSYNILTFSSTVYSLTTYRNQTRNAVQSNTHQRESLILFGKLFIVTGISWVLELISNALPGKWWYWILFDVYNLLQAILIFLIFGMKRENLVFLYQKYPSLRFLLIPILRTSCFYAETFDPEKTEMTGVPYDCRNSRIQYRRGSNMSTSSNTAVTYKQ